MKRLIKIAIIMLIVFITVATPITAAPITAVAANSPTGWAAERVNEAIGLNLVSKSLQSNYTQAITRAEFCSLATTLYEAANGVIVYRIKFADTTDINVEKMAAVEVVAGVGDNKFAPNQKLTREQAAVLVTRLGDAIGASFPHTDADFADAAAFSDWAVEGIGRAQAAGIMSGMGNNLFSPRDPYTREQSIMTMMRVYDYVIAKTGKTPVAAKVNSLPFSQSLKKGMTDAEFNEAYAIAYEIVKSYAGLSRLEQIEGVYEELAYIRHTTPWEYSMSKKHYNDAYGFFLLNMTSCAGDVRAAGFCFTILGIPYEHENENKTGHQWARVALDDGYAVVDINAPFLGDEYEPHKHPLQP